MIYIDEYCKNLISKKNKQEEQILQRLIQHGNMPVLDKYKGCLSTLQEMIVKIIYIAGQPLFLKDIKLMLVTSAEESVIDNNIKKLVEMGYLLRLTSDFGLAFVLTKEALSIIEEYDDMPTAFEMKGLTDTTVIKRRVKSAVIADAIFTKMIGHITSVFYSENKEYRNSYAIKQYLKQVEYREFISLPECKRLEYFTDIDISDEVRQKFMAVDKYDCNSANEYSNVMFRQLGYTVNKQKESYRKYIRVIKAECLNEPYTLDTFYFLKDYWNDTKTDDDSYMELKTALLVDSSVFKYGLGTVQRKLAAVSKDSKLAADMQIELLDGYINSFAVKRRNLVKSNAFRADKDDEELIQCVATIRSLDDAIEEMTKRRNDIADDFYIHVLDDYRSEESKFIDVLAYMKLMERKGIFIKDVSFDEGLVSFDWLIIQQNEVLSSTKLAKILNLIMLYSFRVFPFARFSVEFYVLDDNDAEMVTNETAKAKAMLKEFQETRLAGELIDDVEVNSICRKFYKRNDFYAKVISKMKEVIL